MTFEKLERDGEVAVLYSPGYGAGWFTWNLEHSGMVFDREIVEAVLAGDTNKAASTAEQKYNAYTGGSDQLRVRWLPKGTRFEIDEYAGNEGIRIFKPDDGLVA